MVDYEYLKSCFLIENQIELDKFIKLIADYVFLQNNKFKFCEKEYEDYYDNFHNVFLSLLKKRDLLTPRKNPDGSFIRYKVTDNVDVYPLESNYVVKVFKKSSYKNIDEIMKGFILKFENVNDLVTHPIRIFKTLVDNRYYVTLMMEEMDTNLKKYISEITPNYNSDFIIDIFFQIVFILEYLQINYGLIHNDLHLENILIKKRPQPISNIYGGITISSNYIVKISDFGLSCINLLNCENCLVEINIIHDFKKCKSKCYDLLFLFTNIIENLYYYENGKFSDKAKILNIPDYDYDNEIIYNQTGNLRDYFLNIIYFLIFKTFSKNEKRDFIENYWLTLYRHNEDYEKYIFNPKYMKNLMLNILKYIQNNLNLNSIKLNIFIKDKRKICLMFLGGLPSENEKNNINAKNWTKFFETISKNKDLSKKYVICIHNIEENTPIPNYLSNYFKNIKHIIMEKKDHLRTAWGSISLLDASLCMINKSYEKFPSIKKFILVDKLSIPLLNPLLILNKLMKDDKSRIQMYNGETIQDKIPKDNKYDYGFKESNCNVDYLDRLANKVIKKSSQWFVLDIKHAKLILNMAYKKIPVQKIISDAFKKESDMLDIYSPKEMYKIHASMNKNFAIDELFMSTYILYQIYENFFYSKKYLETIYNSIYDEKQDKINPNQFLLKLNKILKTTDAAFFEYVTASEIKKQLYTVNEKDFYLRIIRHCNNRRDYYEMDEEYNGIFEDYTAKNIKKLLMEKPIRIKKFITRENNNIFIPPMFLFEKKVFIKFFSNSLYNDIATKSNQFKKNYCYISQTYVHWYYFNILPQNVLRNMKLLKKLTVFKSDADPEYYTITNLLDYKPIELLKILDFNIILDINNSLSNALIHLEVLPFSAHPLEFFNCTFEQFLNGYIILCYIFYITPKNSFVKDGYYDILIYWNLILFGKHFNENGTNLVEKINEFYAIYNNVWQNFNVTGQDLIKIVQENLNNNKVYRLDMSDEILAIASAKDSLFIRKVNGK